MLIANWWRDILRAADGEDGGGGGILTLDGTTSQTAGAEAGRGADTVAGAEGGDTQAGAEGQQGETKAETKGDEAAQWPERGFPDDWRNRLTDGLPPDLVEKLNQSKRLERAKSPQDLLRTIASLDSMVGEAAGRVKLPTGKGDDPKDVAAFRKAWGVPEAADKYDVWRPKDAGEMNEADQAIWSEVLPEFHAADFSQRQVDQVAKVWSRLEQRAVQEIESRAAQAREAAEEDLRVEWGKDYKANVNLTSNWLKQKVPGFIKEGEDILTKRFADGTSIAAHPGWVKFFHSMAVADSDADPFIAGEPAGGAPAEQRIKELRELQKTDAKRYASKEVQDELIKLLEVQERRKQRAA